MNAASLLFPHETKYFVFLLQIERSTMHIGCILAPIGAIQLITLLLSLLTCNLHVHQHHY